MANSFASNRPIDLALRPRRQEMPSPRITQITDKASHDAIAGAGERGTPTVIYVSFSPLPACRSFTPKFEQLAADATLTDRGIVFAQMELDKETTPILKFGVQTCPICICLRKGWCRTLLGDDIKALQKCIRDELLEGR